MANVYTTDWQRTLDQGSYGVRAAPVGTQAGATQVGVSVYELDPGKRNLPYHAHFGVEEIVVVLRGTPTLRTPEGERTLEPGDTVCFPAGPDGAHLVRNAGEQGDVRVAILSTKNEFGIAEYPDSDKLGVWAGGQHYMLRRSAHLDYWDGER
jgi:uncharacterized cupin superfamily protein